MDKVEETQALLPVSSALIFYIRTPLVEYYCAYIMTAYFK